MCGIAGIVAVTPGAAPPTSAELERMAGALRHRGPDEAGLYRDARAGLAHARLSIIDLTTGQQPLANEDRTLWIVFNGEIFNFVELRAELVQRGHRFTTRSDTEVAVHAYEEWGADAFARFNGQWALALWDARARTLVLSRDPMGICPLYTVEHAGRLYFASELRAIFAADPTVPRGFDPRGLDETFTFWTVVPPRSVFRGVSELPPGSMRTVGERDRAAATHVLEFEPSFRGSVEDAAVAVRAALKEATRLRMVRADVPVGSYLSGGLDSSLIAALGRGAIGGKLETFSLRFDDAEYDETEFQRLMARRLGSSHHEVVVARGDIARAFPDVVAHAERPVLRTAPAPLYLLSRLVREAGIKVVLTGEGADEMFAGYDLFREGKVRRFWARDPRSRLRPRLLQRLYPYLARSPVAQRAVAEQFFGRDLDRAGEPGFAHGPRWRSTAALKRLLRPEMRIDGDAAVTGLLAGVPAGFAAWDPLAQDQWLEIKVLLGGYLLSSQGDRMLMAHSIEGRFPFLDPEVIALAASLPPEYKLAVLDEKHVLKRAAADLVPETILRRKKQPYRAPDALAFAGPDRPAWIDEVLDPRAIADAGVFEPGAVAALWAKCRGRVDEGQFSNADNMALVGVLSTQLLWRDVIKRTPDAAPVTIGTRIEPEPARLEID
jgi:asparagine synthase (glutamine-hydrolysing)